MQSSTKTSAQTEYFDILLFDQFSNHCLANTVEPLRAVNRLTNEIRYRWRFLTIDGNPVESSSGLRIEPDGSLPTGNGAKLFVMPSYGFRDLGVWHVTKQLRSAARRYDTLIGLDTGSWLLAQAGLLNGYRATIHWEELTSFAETYPEVTTERARFTIDRNRITCSGAMAAFDLVMQLIGEDHDPLLAIEVSQLFMTLDAGREHAPTQLRGGRKVNQAISIMSQNLETPLSIEEIARKVGFSQKTFELRMRAAFKATPQTVYRRLRLNLARKLVIETELSVSEIAARCGYDNASAMTRAFKDLFGQTPRTLGSGPIKSAPSV